MKTRQSIFYRAARAFIFLTLAALALPSCELFFSKSAASSGSISFETSWGGSTGIARTLRPASASIAVASYSYHLVGPGGVVVDGTDTTGTKSFSNLVVGSWTATVTGLNASSVTLLTGTKTFPVSASQNATVSVAMTAAAGNGTVSFALTMPGFITNVTGTIQVEATGSTPTDISTKIGISGNVATYTDTLAAGTYRLILSLKNTQASTVGMLIEDLDVFAGIATNPSFTLRDVDLNQVPVAPAAPTAAAGDGQVTLSLTSIPGATGYNVYYGAGSTAASATTKTSGSPYTTILNPVITGLTNGTQYAFIATAINVAGEGTASAAVTATPASAGGGGIPRTGLVAEYLFNGNANDTAGTNNGTVSGATLTVDRFETNGKAYSFNGSATITTAAGSSILKPMMPFSFSIWYKPDSLNINQPILMNDDDNSVYAGARIYLLHDGKVDAEICDAGGKNSFNRKDFISTESVLPIGQWTHISAVFTSADSINIFLNGDKLITYIDGSATSLGYLNGVFSIGKNASGLVDDVRIYNRALTDSEVIALYTEGGWNGTQPLLTMLPVAGGSFNNGTSNVILSSFLMSKYEVTQYHYQTVTGNNPSYFTGDTNRPVEQVTWYDAVEFCNKLSTRDGLENAYTIASRTPSSGYPITSATVTADWTKTGYRLPTEAQWEYAARGGVSSLGYTWAGSNDVNAVAWYAGNSESSTHAVGGKLANELGLSDMSGNVWEWCWDWYGSLTGEAKTDPTGPVTGTTRVRRSGCWYNSSGGCALIERGFIDPGTRDYYYGFRVVRPDPNAATVPTNLIATAGAGQVSLSWTASTNATSYNVYYKSGSATATTSDTKASTAMISGTTATITDLTGGTQHGFVVTALKGSVESPAGIPAAATPTVASGVPRNGLVAEYLFNGNANDTAGTNNGTVNGATLAVDRFGNAGKAYSFDGLNDYIQLAQNNGLRFPWTFSGWVKTSDNSIIQSIYCSDKHDWYWGDYNGFNISLYSTGYYSMIGCGVPRNNAYSTSRIPSQIQFEHIVVIFNSITDVNYYINNQSYSVSLDGGYSPATFLNSPDRIGRSYDGNNRTFFKGSIDDIRIYNRALTDAEVTALYTENGYSPENIQVFTTIGTSSWTVPTGVTSVEVLVVGGGGAGGMSDTGGGGSGGGGAGGLIYASSYAVIPGQSITVTVGKGGAGTAIKRIVGEKGSDSVFGTLIALGGGGGGAGASNGTRIPPTSGGSGGGGCYNSYSAQDGAAADQPGSASTGFGNAGGNNPGVNAGAGGGGAGGPGGNAAANVGGTRGAGLTYSITGSSVVYAEGGEGGLAADGSNAAANTGTGGGGSYYGSSGSGGSGIVIIKF